MDVETETGRGRKIHKRQSFELDWWKELRCITFWYSPKIITIVEYKIRHFSYEVFHHQKADDITTSVHSESIYIDYEKVFFAAQQDLEWFLIICLEE